MYILVTLFRRHGVRVGLSSHSPFAMRRLINMCFPDRLILMALQGRGMLLYRRCVRRRSGVDGPSASNGGVQVARPSPPTHIQLQVLPDPFAGKQLIHRSTSPLLSYLPTGLSKRHMLCDSEAIWILELLFACG